MNWKNSKETKPTVPNQLTVINTKKENYPAGTFHTAPTKEVFEALQVLSPHAFALYYYFLKNKPGYEMPLYAADFVKTTGYSKSSYHRAMKELKERGYLSRPNDYGLTWLFTP